MSFDAVADDYELLIPPGPRLAREGPVLADWVGSADSLIELACGTGAHAHWLVEHCPGLRVQATDLSPAMIAVARRCHAHDRLELAVGDMLAPPPGPVQRLLVLGNSLNLLPDRATVGRCLAAIATVLAPGGRVLVQCTNPACPANREARSTTRQLGEDAVLCKQTVPVGDRRMLAINLFRRTAGEWQSRSMTAVLLDLTVDELQDLAAAAGLQPDLAWGALDGQPLDPAVGPDLVLGWRRA